VTGSDHKSEEQQPAAVKASLRPVEELHSLLLRISHFLDYETSARKTLYHRLLAIDDQTKKTLESLTKRRSSPTFFRYLVAICIGVAGTLAWQSSFGEATKQIIATRAPELGWSPKAKQMIASWVEQLGWTKPLAGSENVAVQSPAQDTPEPKPAPQIAPDTVASKAPTAPSPDQEQLQQIARDLTTLRQTVEQIAGGQDKMAREIVRLLGANVEILLRMREWEDKFAAAPAQKPMPAPPSSRTPIPPR